MAELSDEQRMMRQSCRDYVDKVVIPFIRGNWQREWNMVPEERLPVEVLEGAQQVGIRTLGVPEEFGGVELDKATVKAVGDRIGKATGRKIELASHVDSDILGGIVLRVGNSILDASIRNRLDQLRRQVAKAA